MKTIIIARIITQVQLSSKMWHKQLLFIMFSSEVILSDVFLSLVTIICGKGKRVNLSVNPL
jgi:NADH:ubiquinone oxidoreductase subunit K